MDERRRAAEAPLRGADVEMVGRRGHDPALRVRGIVRGAEVDERRRAAEASLRGAEVELVGRRGHDPALRAEE